MAGRKGMDLAGVIVLGVVTALGGGTIRDVLLGAQPVFWIGDLWYLGVAVCAAGAAFVAVRWAQPPAGWMIRLDALGLAVFTVVGTERAIAANVHVVIAVLLGVMTGVAGGMTRDLLAGEPPVILHRDLYATASAAGAVVFVMLLELARARAIAALAAVGVVLGLRFAAVRWGLALPRLHLR